MKKITVFLLLLSMLFLQGCVINKLLATAVSGYALYKLIDE